MSKLDMVLHSGPTPMASSNTSSDLLWQRLTRLANTLYENGDAHRAFEEYRRALHEAERLLALAQNGAGPARAASIFVISHHNMAEIAVDIKTPDAARHFQTPFDTLLTLAALPSTPIALRESCIANLKEATSGLVAYLQDSGAPTSAIADVIKKVRFVVAATPSSTLPAQGTPQRLC